MSRTRRQGEQRGQATVEFAIVMPLVLLLIAGVIEFGTAFNYWLSLNHIANEGARWAAINKLPPDNSTPTSDQIRAYLLTQIAGQELHDDLAAPGRIKICAAAGAGIGDQARVVSRRRTRSPSSRAWPASRRPRRRRHQLR